MWEAKTISRDSLDHTHLHLNERELSLFFSLSCGSSLIEISYFLWEIFGYLNLWAIFLETALVLTGSLFLINGIISKRVINWKWMVSASLIFISIQIFLFSNTTGLRIPTIIFITGIFTILFSFLILQKKYGLTTVVVKRYAMGMLVFLFISTIIIGIFYLRYFPSDESAIDTYAAILFLHGINPYNHGAMMNTISIMHYPEYLGTPILSGGYVQSLGYPVLSFIAYLPTAILSIKPSLIQESLTIIPFVILVIEYTKKGFVRLLPVLFLGILSSTIILSEGLNGGNGFLWSSLLMISYIYLRKPAVSGVLFGLAISVKQLPIFVLPFMIVVIIKDHGIKKVGIWIFAIAATFFAINGYFILLNPAGYVKSILSPELTPLMGVGMGISQLSFLGFANIPRTLFTYMMICTVILLTAIFILYYERLKYMLFVFPILILLFNYRVSIEYFLYWVALCFSVIPFMLSRNETEDKKPKKAKTHRIMPWNRIIGEKGKWKVGAIIIIVIAMISAGTLFSTNPHNTVLEIQSVSAQPLQGNQSFADRMNITVYYSSSSPEGTSILFRIVEPGKIINENGLVWKIHDGNNTLLPGTSKIYTISTNISAEYLSLSESYYVIAYASGIVSSKLITVR